jgi:exopolysaccharide/PEP-CTERM locus tyrosine autokinase
MSLVERTLKKLQDAKSAGQADASKPAQLGASQARTHTDTDRDGAAPRPERQLVPVETTRIVKIDREELRKIDLLPPPDMERRIASQYQQIKRALVSRILKGAPGLGPMGHVVMLASAMPGDGKTFTSINLALSLALEKDIEVLLVDADVAKPHVSRIFGVEQERGLIDLLVDRSLRASQVILRTDVPGLSLLPAGSKTESATELIASDRMAEIVSQLSAPGDRRIVLFDSPPLLLSTESCALAASAGQVVLVVRADVTSRQAVSNAIEAIGGNKPVSLILNQVNAQPADGYYGYGSYGDAAKA